MASEPTNNLERTDERPLALDGCNLHPGDTKHIVRCLECRGKILDRRLGDARREFNYTYGGQRGKRGCAWNRARRRCEILERRLYDVLKRLLSPEVAWERLVTRLQYYKPLGRPPSKFRLRSERLRLMIDLKRMDEIDLLEEVEEIKELRGEIIRRTPRLWVPTHFHPYWDGIESPRGKRTSARKGRFLYERKVEKFKASQGKPHPLRQVQSAVDIDEIEVASAIAKAKIERLEREQRWYQVDLEFCIEELASQKLLYEVGRRPKANSEVPKSSLSRPITEVGKVEEREKKRRKQNDEEVGRDGDGEHDVEVEE